MDNRRDEWRQGVDENLASLTTGQRVNDRLIEDLELGAAKIEELIHGTDTGGIVGRLESLEHTVAELRAVVIMDATGKQGLQAEVRELKEAREDRRTTFGNITKILIAVIGSGLIGHFWQDIQDFFIHPSGDRVTQMILKAESKPKKHHRYVIHEEALDDDSK